MAGPDGQVNRLNSDLEPTFKNTFHQDSIFGNAFSCKANYVVHPEWVSEGVSRPPSQPLQRPPWPWEQPRYRRVQQVPASMRQVEQPTQPELMWGSCQSTPSRLTEHSYLLPCHRDNMYMFTQPLHPSLS